MRGNWLFFTRALPKSNTFSASDQQNFNADRPRPASFELGLICELASGRKERVGNSPTASAGSEFRTTPPEQEFDTMGYFVLTTVFTLQYLGYVPIPTGVLVLSCVAYVLYDTFRR
jgi:hypothetical protein